MYYKAGEKHYISKASVKRCVSSKDLKHSKLSSRRSEREDCYINSGAADEKARSTKTFFSLSDKTAG